MIVIPLWVAYLIAFMIVSGLAVWYAPRLLMWLLEKISTDVTYEIWRDVVNTKPTREE